MNDRIGDNLALIVAAWTDMFRRGSTDSLESLKSRDDAFRLVGRAG